MSILFLTQFGSHMCVMHGFERVPPTEYKTDGLSSNKGMYKFTHICKKGSNLYWSVLLTFPPKPPEILNMNLLNMQ